ncbi:MAG: MBL fold metallo-hydrolase [Deltaproteobacteria bacterium]|nr:MBL fold metallo-hydrolase [Deltaproteobacteria bacterium]
MKMTLQTLTVGPAACTCSVVACAETGEAAIVDPGGDADAILAEVASMGVNVRLLLHTHAHFDHILGTGEVAAATAAEILLHAGDRDLYENLPRQARTFGFYATRPPAASRLLAGGETLAIGRLSALVVHTPGHTPGSVGYYFAAPSPLLLAGDTLFAEGVGRTDFPGGSFEDLQISIRERLYVLPGETRVIPGHGPETTIAHERKHNPFVRAYGQ